MEHFPIKKENGVKIYHCSHDKYPSSTKRFHEATHLSFAIGFCFEFFMFFANLLFVFPLVFNKAPKKSHLDLFHVQSYSDLLFSAQ
jgi:hypothetical protein